MAKTLANYFLHKLARFTLSASTCTRQAEKLLDRTKLEDPT